MPNLQSSSRGRDPRANRIATAFIFLLFVLPVSLFAQLSLKCIMITDKDAYCPGEIATITIKGAYNPDAAGQYYIWTENYRHEYNNCRYAGCTILDALTPQATGEGVISTEVVERYGCGEDPWKVSTIEIKVRPMHTTTIDINWVARWMEGRDEGCGHEERVVETRNYYGSIELKVKSKEKPEVNPQNIVMNLGDPYQIIVASGQFESIPRYFRFMTTECNQTVLNEYKFYQGNSVAHGVFANKLGTQQYTIVKDDNNCLSEPAQATVTVKACGLHKYGCDQEAVDLIDSKSCEPGAGVGRNDYHLYTLEKKICTGCDINEVWQNYKTDVHNQAIVISDQLGVFANYVPEARSLPLPEFLVPDKTAPQPITDCATLDLPRLTTWMRQVSLVAEYLPGGSTLRGFRKLMDKCAKNPGSFTDPIFLRVNESSKCVTNYTKPGHALYPGKVTRCIVQDCDSVKILTFGEGVTEFPNSTCGAMLAWINDKWGSSMFTNVDNRAYENIKPLNSPQRYYEVNARPVAVTAEASPFLSNKVWRIKSLDMEYDGLDSVYNFYTYNDTSNFFNLRAVNIRFNSDGKTSGTNIDGAATESNWSYDESTHTLTTDTASMEIYPLSENSFSITGVLPVFKDTSIVRGSYTFTFASDLAALPVKFGALKAETKNCKVDLSWDMHTDDPGTLSYVERRTENNWFTIATVQAGKNQRFQFTDSQPSDGLNEYRIRSVETNGAVTYSRIVTAVNKCGSQGIAVYPNPVGNQLSVLVPAGWEQSVITIVNAQGQLKYSGRLHTGENLVVTAAFAPGVYFLKVMHNNKQLYHHAVIKK